MKIPPFEIHEQLGHGGMAIVYKATHPEYGLVALRVIPKSSAEDVIAAERNGVSQHMRLVEAKCPCVPRAYPAHDDAKYFCAPVEFVDGVTVARILEDGPLPETEALRIAEAVCANLEFSHRCPGGAVIHGDIKPSNVMLDKDRSVKVLDYGISKALREDRTRTQQMFGAACYSSPERHDRKTVDAGDDLWAAGVMLYEMAAGYRPYDGDVVEVRQQFREKRRPAPLRNVSDGFRAVASKALSLDRARRYPAASAMLADIQRLRRGERPLAMDEPSTEDRTRQVGQGTTSKPGGATVRTTGSTGGGDRTERAPAEPQVRSAGAGPSPLTIYVRRAILAGAVVAGFVAVSMGWTEYSNIQAAGELRKSLERRNDVTPADWSEYERLRGELRMPLVLSGAERMIRDRYREFGERAIKDYREGFGWKAERRKSAETYLRRALDMDPSDKRVRSMQLLVEGYGMSMKDPDLAQQAIGVFERSAELDPNSPDAYLGIARYATYGLADSERAERALTEARKRGYHTLDRETALMADCYRMHANSLMRGLRGAGCDNLDPAILARIRDYASRALQNYKAIPQFTGTASGLQIAQGLFDKASSMCASGENKAGATK